MQTEGKLQTADYRHFKYQVYICRATSIIESVLVLNMIIQANCSERLYSGQLSRAPVRLNITPVSLDIT